MTKKMTVWISKKTHEELLEFLKEDSNTLFGGKIRQGAVVDIALQLLFLERKNKTLQQILDEINNRSKRRLNQRFEERLNEMEKSIQQVRMLTGKKI